MSTDPSTPPSAPEPAPSPPSVPVEDKTVAILSYLTLIGFIVALVLNNGEKKNRLGQYHLRQALGLMILHLGGMVAFFILAFVFRGKILGGVLALGSNGYFICLLILFIIGLIDALNGREKPVPVVGELIQQKLAGAFQ